MFRRFLAFVALACMLPSCDVVDTIVGHAICLPSDSRDPDCIQGINSAFEILSTEHTHVLIMPGIAGAVRCDNILFGIDIEASLEGDLVDQIRRPDFSFVSGVDLSAASAQIWDWTKDLEGDFCELFGAPDEDELTSRLYESEKTLTVARKLAAEIYRWSEHPMNSGRELTIVAGSGAALIVLLAAEDPFLSNESDVLKRVVFVSAAVSTERSLNRLNELTTDGIYNYFSYNDATLQGYICNGGQQLEYRWPAAGRFGYRENGRNSSIVRAQLPWFPEYSADLNNNGEHMHAYRKEFFLTHLRPLIVGGRLTDAWRTPDEGGVAREYRDSAIADDAVSALANAPRIPDPAASSSGVVLIVPGHEDFQSFFVIKDLINDNTSLETFVWDWVEVDEVDELEEEERLGKSVLAAAARALANEISAWRIRNPGNRLHLMAVSSGTIMTSIACDIPAETGIGNAAIDSVLFSSALASNARSIEGIQRCSASGLFNYYSGGNDELLGTDFDCSFASDANPIEEKHDNIMAGVEDAVPWPAAGRFGYRILDAGGDSSRLWQLGWIETHRSYGNSGDFLDELSRSFAERFFLAIWTGVALDEQWQSGIRDEYLDVRKRS